MRSGPECCRRRGRNCTSCARNASRIATSSSMSVMTAKIPSTRPPTARSGNSVIRTPAQFARRLALATLERDLRPAERPVDVVVHVGERPAGDQLLHPPTEQIVGRDADPVAERLVREPELEVAIEVDDRRAHAVGDEAEPMLASARLELEPLQLVDVGIAHEKAANLAVRAAIRVIIDVNPDGGPALHGELMLETRALTRERRPRRRPRTAGTLPVP